MIPRSLVRRASHAAALTAASLAVAAPSALGGSVSTTSSIDRQLSASLSSYANRSGADDPQYFFAGDWISAAPGCWWCNASAGGAAAIQSRAVLASDPSSAKWFRTLSQFTMDRVISARQLASGAFSGAGQASDGCATISFANELALAYLAVGPDLAQAVRDRWLSSLRRAVRYLVNEGHTRWYINGNYNAASTSLLWMFARITGDPADAAEFERSLEFLVRPAGDRWRGYGLMFTQAPTLDSWADAKGYLTEEGASGPGYDPEYGQLQIDYLARLFALSRDARVGRILNALVNLELDRVRSDGWLDAGRGSRHPEAERWVPFVTPGISALVRLGGRADLTASELLSRELAASTYKWAQERSDLNIYRGLSTQLATRILIERPEIMPAN